MSASSSSQRWETLFPYGSPYEAQRDGIEKAISTADDDGFLLLEGACGTGKTLISLMAGIQKVRDPQSKFERVMCMTSVKQQLKAFEDDIRSINENLSEDTRPVSALSLVGKADVCSYVDAGYISNDDIYTSCESLRNQTRSQASLADDKEKELGKIVDEWSTPAGSTVNTDEWDTDYEAGDPMDDSKPIGCPFYAEYLRKSETTGDEEPVMELGGLNTANELTEKASNNGMCPHSVMFDSLEHTEVLIGNYRHAFDPLTVEAMTGKLLDETTFVVCDEAHTLVEVVRDLREEEMSLFTIDRALETELDLVVDPSNTTQRNLGKHIVKKLATNLALSEQKTKKRIASYRNLVRDLRRKLVEFSDKACKEEFGDGWQRIVASGNNLPQTIEKPLRDPETVEKDTLTEWFEESGFEVNQLGDFAEQFADAVKEASQEDTSVSTRLQTYSNSIGRVFDRWMEADHKTHFREVELTHRSEEWNDPDNPWEGWYNPRFVMKNCIPRSAISETLDSFGAGIIMSATLEPFDAYKQETGLNSLSRPVEEVAYGLNFPSENRESIIADTTKFTYGNRGSPDETNNVRSVYGELIRDVAETTDGNVLIGMPSYGEAEWAHSELKSVDKQVLLDKSSTNEETEQLKQQFFAGEGKVLITSMRGTLTEGVDYDGDRLDACVICGLPIRDMRSPHATAIETAYKSRFGDFEGYAIGFAVPALRKARQTLGRVIRSDDDKGIRVMADGRYASGYLRQYIPSYEKRDYDVVEPRDVAANLRVFWRRQN